MKTITYTHEQIFFHENIFSLVFFETGAISKCIEFQVCTIFHFSDFFFV
jgi:hypothetical protein